MPPATLAVLAAGGMVGASLRRVLAEVWTTRSGEMPWPTVVVNGGGSFALGLLLVVLAERHPERRLMTAFATAGLVGSFTTMSSFLVEVAVLVDEGHHLVAGAHLAGTVVAGVGLAWAGLWSGRRWVGRP